MPFAGLVAHEKCKCFVKRLLSMPLNSYCLRSFLTSLQEEMAGTDVLAVAWLLAWFAASSLIVESPLTHADAIVIMSGSAVVNERAELAAQLYKSGRAPAIILTNDNQQSSWSSAEQRNPFYYERALALLTAAGVPRGAIRFCRNQFPEPTKK